MADVTSRLQPLINGSVQHKDLPDKLRAILTDIEKDPIEESIIKQLHSYTDIMVNDSVSLVVSRPAFTELVSRISSSSGLSRRLPPPALRALANFILERLQPRLISFEEQAVALRQELASMFEREGALREAATVLSQMPLESGQKQYASDFKLGCYLRTARLYLDAIDNVGGGEMGTLATLLASAETFVSRSAMLEKDVKDALLTLLYKTCSARVLEQRCRFLEAALRYYELSLSLPARSACILRSHEPLDERTECLRRALLCTVLAPAGRQRTRLIGSLYRDERTQLLTAPLPSFLEKMFLERLISAEEVKELDAAIKSFYRASTLLDVSILERAVVEHNLIAASRLYDAITFDSLANLINVPASRAEKVAASMISEGRLEGCIDQPDRIIRFFESSTASSTVATCVHAAAQPAVSSASQNGPAGAAAVTTSAPHAASVIETQDASLSALCAHLNVVLERIANSVPPDWLKAKLAAIDSDPALAASSSTSSSSTAPIGVAASSSAAN